MIKTMWAVVPVKCLTHSKTRLAPVLDRAQRSWFTLLMLQDVLGQLSQVEMLHGVGVLSDDERVKQLARQLGLRVWSERADKLNPGLQAVARGLAGEGSGVMIVPCDVPAARAQDYRQLLAGHKAISLVAAVADGGTNALACDANLDMSFYFGQGSFNAHLQEAERLGIAPCIAAPSGLQRDIDRPEDLRWLLASSQNCRARDYLRELPAESIDGWWEKSA